MKWFYIFSFIIVTGLVLSPMVFLSDEYKKRNKEEFVYRNVYSSAVKSIDPATCGDVTSSSIQENIYQGLYTYHYLKRPVVVEPQLADSLPKVSDDGLTYIIKLKKGILFHRNPCFGIGPEGAYGTREVETKDFILALKRVADYHINTGLAWAFIANRIAGLDAFREQTRQYKIGDFSRYNLPVEGLTALDRHTLQIKLTAPFPQFIYVLAMHVYAPVPHEAVDYWLCHRNDPKRGRIEIPEHERSPEFMEQPQVIGTGPYMLTEWKRKWKITLEKNPDYGDDFYPAEGESASEGYEGDSAAGLLADAGKKLPFLNKIYFRFMEETYPAWKLFLSRQIDVAGIPRETFETVVTPGKDLTDEWKKRHIFLDVSTEPTVYWIIFNMEDSIMGASKALRQAISLGFDVENYIQILYNGRGKRAVNCIPSSFAGHREGGPSPYARYDLDAARQKIAVAKEELKRAGKLVDGEIPELILDLSSGAYAMRQADFTKQQFANIGLKLKPVFNDWPTLQRKVNNKQVQMYFMGWAADYPDAENFLQLYYSGNIDKGTNNSNFSHPVFDSLYKMIVVMPDSKERTAIYGKMIKIISEECPVMMTSEYEQFTLFNAWVKNFKAHPILNATLKYRRIDTELRKKITGRN